MPPMVVLSHRVGRIDVQEEADGVSKSLEHLIKQIEIR